MAIRCRTIAHRGAAIELRDRIGCVPTARYILAVGMGSTALSVRLTDSECGFAHQMMSFRAVAARWTSADKADATAQAIGGVVIGYVVQSAFIDLEIDVDLYCNGLEQLGWSNVDTAKP